MTKDDRLKLAVQLVSGTLPQEVFADPGRHHEAIAAIKGAYDIVVALDRSIPAKGPASLRE